MNLSETQMSFPSQLAGIPHSLRNPIDAGNDLPHSRDTVEWPMEGLVLRKVVQQPDALFVR